MPKPQFLLDLEQNGYVVVPNVIPQTECDDFIEAGWSWLESFPHKFSRRNKKTWTRDHLPASVKGGQYSRYAISHESFVWKIRSHPSVPSIFSQIWSTTDFLASFDGINISLPVHKSHGRKDMIPSDPWPHIDQDPEQADHFQLYQGIATLTASGPNDGGLTVLSGSHALHPQFFTETAGIKKKKDGLGRQAGHNFRTGDVVWYKARGCREVKVCAGKGHLILWDSRTIHWGATPVGDVVRFAAYVCYFPRELVAPYEVERKGRVFRERKGTNHDPRYNEVADEFDVPRRPDGSIDKANRTRPLRKPEETATVLRLAGCDV